MTCPITVHVSGTLNLQNREMTMIPDDVYRLNDPELLKSLVGDSDDLKWWETEPIAKLYLCSNKITSVELANLTLVLYDIALRAGINYEHQLLGCALFLKSFWGSILCWYISVSWERRYQAFWNWKIYFTCFCDKKYPYILYIILRNQNRLKANVNIVKCQKNLISSALALSSLSSISTRLSPKNFEKKGAPLSTINQVSMLYLILICLFDLNLSDIIKIQQVTYFRK